MAAFSRVEDETPNSLHSSRGVSWMIIEASLHSLCFSLPPYRHGQTPSPPISLPVASHVFLSSLTSDTSLFFICLFSHSLPSRVGLFFFKSCPPPRSKLFLPQSFSLRAVGEAERPPYGSELRPKSSYSQSAAQLCKAANFACQLTS